MIYLESVVTFLPLAEEDFFAVTFDDEDPDPDPDVDGFFSIPEGTGTGPGSAVALPGTFPLG
ncbi:hypothetical protein WG66_009471 [Moniliophthora roreri]|nr:hypothetical protein WG66_009471 [Moniliophthora roreri]